jgi:hypothetical protein
LARIIAAYQHETYTVHPNLLQYLPVHTPSLNISSITTGMVAGVQELVQQTHFHICQCQIHNSYSFHFKMSDVLQPMLNVRVHLYFGLDTYLQMVLKNFCSYMSTNGF